MHAVLRAGLQVFEREVAIADGVDAVGREPAETEAHGDGRAVVDQRRAGHGAGTKRQRCGGLARAFEP